MYYTYTNPEYTTYIKASPYPNTQQLIILGIGLVLILLNIIALWRIFRRAGEHGWASIIPLYRDFVYYKVTWGNGWMFLLALFIALADIFAIGVCAFDLYMGKQSLAIIMGVIAAMCTIIGFAVHCLTAKKLSKAFDYGVGYTFGMVFLPYIFTLIIGFGKNPYKKPWLVPYVEYVKPLSADDDIQLY